MKGEREELEIELRNNDKEINGYRERGLHRELERNNKRVKNREVNLGRLMEITKK